MSRWCGYQRRGRLHWRYRRLIRRFSFCKCLRAAADRARPGPHLHTCISSVLYANGIYGPPVAFPDDFCVEFPGMTWPATLKGPSLQGLPCFCFFISILLHHIHFNIYSFFLYFDPFIPASLQCLLFFDPFTLDSLQYLVVVFLYFDRFTPASLQYLLFFLYFDFFSSKLLSEKD